MPTLPAVMVTLLLPFEHLFDPRTWRKAQLLAMGAILSPGKRTVSSALNILGIGQHGDFAIYIHVLNRAQWSPLQLMSRVKHICRSCCLTRECYRNFSIWVPPQPALIPALQGVLPWAHQPRRRPALCS